MSRAEALNSALADVKRAAEAMEQFLSLHAPPWAGYGNSIAELAAELSGREATAADIRMLQDRAYDPFRGTFGSMHDLSFFGSLEDDYQKLRQEIGRALDAVDAAFRAPGPLSPK